jgi:triphosphoribosyl-dephospho-CoA synthase
MWRPRCYDLSAKPLNAANVNDMHKTPGKCAQLACILEVTARKAGNIHPTQSFDDLTHLDFIASAAAIVPALDSAEPLGSTILQAVEATRRLVAGNTNLGIVLLLAPLAAATRAESLRSGLEAVLAGTTVADAANVFRAIRLANPGGLGKAEQQDVRDEPTMPLRDIMALAADRDLIARQYANGFADLWNTGLPALTMAWEAKVNLERAIVQCQLVLMATIPDTLILRKAGPHEAAASREFAARVLDAGWPETEASRRAFADFDAWLRATGHRRNPGATADLVTACLFVALWQNTIPWLDQLTPFVGLDYV